MEIEQSASINGKSDEEIMNESDEEKNEEIKEKKRKRNREYQRAWRQRLKELKKKDSEEEKEDSKAAKRKKHWPYEDLKNYHKHKLKPELKPIAKVHKIPPTLTLKPLDKKDVPRGVRLIKLLKGPNEKITLNKKIKLETTTPSTSAANQIPIKKEIKPNSTSLVYEDNVDSLQHVIKKEVVYIKSEYIQCDNNDGYIEKTEMDKQTSNGDLLVDSLNYDSTLTSNVDVHIKEETIS